MQLKLGVQLGPYEIISALGAGGMGEVYRARDTRLDRMVAVKVLSAHLSDKPEARERFDREARAISALNHPNICHLYDIGAEHGVDFLVMEYVEGETLAERLRRGALPLNQVLKYGAEIADGLERAHRVGIVHRDLKPANIMLAETGAKLMDFGLAKSLGELASPMPTESTATIAAPITSPGAVVGTINYMSPEQARGDTIDTRSDLFAAGAVLYEMTVGRPPFPGRTSAVVFDAILNREPPPPRQVNPEIPEELGKIIAKCLEKDPEVRYQNAADLRADLKRLKRDTDSDDHSRRSSPLSNTSASSVSAPSIAGSSVIVAVNRHKLSFGLGAIALLLLLLAAGFGVYQFTHRPSRIPFQEVEINRVTTSGDLGKVTLSPDGKYLAYLRREEDGRNGLWIRNLASNSNVQVLPPDKSSYDNIAFGPDNNYLYVRKLVDPLQGIDDLLRLPVLGGTTVPVVHNIDSTPTFSADGKSFVFERQNSPARGSTEFASANLDGSDEKRLCTAQGVNYFSPVQSPDGKRLAIIEPLKDEPIMAIAMLDLSTCSESQFFRFAVTSGLEPRQVRWMPNGRGLVMAYRSIYVNQYQLGYLTYPGREFHKITNDLNDYQQISLSADGRSLSAMLNQEDDNITIFPAGSKMSSGDQATVIPGIGFSWLGMEHMSVVENLVADRNITNVDLATKEKSVTFSSANVLPWDVSACTADTIVFTGFSKADLKQSVYVSDLHGANLRRLTFGKGDDHVACSWDGKWVMFFDFSDRSIRKVPLSGGSSQVLVPREQKPMPWFAAVPSRDEILVQVPVKDAWQFQFVSIASGQVIERMPGGGMQQACPVSISPDKKSVDFVPCAGAFDIWRLPKGGGQLQQLSHHGSSRIQDPIWKFAWSPDGQRLAVGRKPLKRDAVILKDVGPP